MEIRAEERLNEEQKRHRELLARVEREAILQNENCQIKIRTIELETNSLREELQRLRTQYDKQTTELRATEEKLEDARENLTMAHEELTETRENEKKLVRMKFEKKKESSLIDWKCFSVSFFFFVSLCGPRLQIFS